MSTIRIGISGWRYEPWRGVFYPENLAQRLELSFASRAFPTIELNGSFYSLQRPESYQTWYEETAANFVFSVKGGRYITHILRLRDCKRRRRVERSFRPRDAGCVALCAATPGQPLEFSDGAAMVRSGRRYCGG